MCPKMGIGTSISTAVSERTAVIIEDYMFDASTVGELQPEESPSDFHDTWDLDGTDFTPEASPDDEGYWDDFENTVLNHNYEELGSELVTNGDFATDSDWSKVSGVTISNGEAIFNNVSANSNGIFQGSVFSANKIYKVTLDVSNYQSGNITVWSGGSQGSSTNETFTGNGTKTWYISSGSTNSFLVISSYNTNGTFSIDNVSVKQVDPNDRWTLGTGVTIEDGKLKINGGALQGAQQSNVITSGIPCSVTFTVSNYVSGTVNLRHPLSQEVSANGTYTFTGDANSTKVLIRGSAVSNEFTIDNVTVKEYAITPLDV